MSSWRYAVTRSYVEGAIPELSGHIYEVREVYVGDDGSLSWTANPINPVGETLRELQDSLARMSSEAFGNVLDLTLDPPQWVDPITVRRKDRGAADVEKAPRTPEETRTCQ